MSRTGGRSEASPPVLKSQEKLVRTDRPIAIVTSVQENSDPVDNETEEDEDNNNNKISKGPSNLRWIQLWSGTNNNQSDVLLNYCCSRESETLRRKNEGVQWYREK
ncbi:hypothetical protein TNCV_3055171 [Trichonephila clavipes]|nr:hypothetical protein TNCV_3055171 [Trichonephila clavipes]